ADTARGILATLDVTRSTALAINGSRAVRWLTGAKAGERALSTAEKIDSGLKAAEASRKWMVAWKGSQAFHIPMEVSNVPFGLMLYKDIRHQIRTAFGEPTVDAGRMAERMTADGRDQEKFPQTPDEIKNYLKLREKQTLVESYRDLLKQGADADKSKKIDEILDTTKRLLDPAASKMESKLFKSNLLAVFHGSQAKIEEQLKAGNRSLTEKGYKADRSLTIAAAVALLLLADEKELPPDAVLATRLLEIEETSTNGVRTTSTPKGTIVSVDTQTRITHIAQKITARELSSILKAELSDKNDAARRMVIGDLLVRTGARSPLSYVSILKETVSNPSTSNENKAVAMIQLGSMINSIQLMETSMETVNPDLKTNLKTALSGISSRELMDVLTKVASGSSDRDLRALAASILHSIGKEFRADELNCLIQSQAREYFARGSSPGKFAEYFINQVKAERLSADPATRLNSILTLRTLGDLGGLTDNKLFNTALADIMTSDRPDVSLVVLSELVIGDPSKDLGETQRKKILHLLEGTTTRENVHVKAAIARKIESFAVTTEERSMAIPLLNDTIDRARTTFAANFPEIRIAAIEALAKLNSQGSAALIMQATNPGKETDGKVRTAAIKAIKVLKVPQMYQFAVDALQQESDPAARVNLLLIRQQYNRPIRNTTYKERKQELMTWLANSQENNPKDGGDWLDKKITDGTYSRFDIAEHKKQVDAAKEEARSMWKEQRNEDSDVEIARIEASKVRTEQWKKLTDMARQNTNDGHNARLALLFLSVGGDSKFGADSLLYRRKAAEEIKTLCQSGSDYRQMFRKGIGQGLTNPN
ncbi:MAG: HEAT repeat domain-containing protein, partial [Cyanobacteria bacterium]|nr:HEAT repeat domain-containing protein [Cyanobacteriota bacterium]